MNDSKPTRFQLESDFSALTEPAKIIGENLIRTNPLTLTGHYFLGDHLEEFIESHPEDERNFFRLKLKEVDSLILLVACPKGHNRICIVPKSDIEEIDTLSARSRMFKGKFQPYTRVVDFNMAIHACSDDPYPTYIYSSGIDVDKSNDQFTAKLIAYTAVFEVVDLRDKVKDRIRKDISDTFVESKFEQAMMHLK